MAKVLLATYVAQGGAGVAVGVGWDGCVGISVAGTGVGGTGVGGIRVGGTGVDVGRGANVRVGTSVGVLVGGGAIVRVAVGIASGCGV